MIRRKLVTRRNRRRPDPSMVPAGSDLTVAVSTTGTTNVTLDYSGPVSVADRVGLSVDTLTIVSQSTPSPTQIVLVMDDDVAGLDWTYPNRDPAVRSSTGGYVTAASGTF